MESSSRLTRSTTARLARHACEPSDGRHLRSEKGQSNWPAAFIDFKLSKRFCAASTKSQPAEDMAPGAIHKKIKPRYAPNHTSLTIQPNSTPSRSARVENGVNDSTATDNTPIQTKSKLPQTQPPVNRTDPTICQTNSRIRQTKSRVTQTQSSTPQGQAPDSSPSESNVHRFHTNESDQRVENDGVNDSTPIDNTPISKKSKVPRTQPLVNRTEPTIDQTNSRIRQNKSSLTQTQSSTPQGEAPHSSRSESNVHPFQTNESEPSVRATQSGEDTESEPYEDEANTGVLNKPKRKRGPTVGRGIMKGMGGSKMKIEVDPVIGRPRKREQSAKFSSQIGVVARDVLPVIRKWKEIDVKNALDPCVDHMQIYLDVNVDKPGVKQSVIERLKISSRQRRHRLHKYYLMFPNMEEAKKKMPPTLSADQQDEWNSLCEYFNSPEFKHRSKVNKENREKIRAPQTSGRTSFCVIENELAKEAGEDGDNIAIDMYEETHTNADGWLTEEAEMNWEVMVSNREGYHEEGIEMKERDIVTEVLGPASGYIKGVGYGPKPPGKCSSSRHLQQELDETRKALSDSRSETSNLHTVIDSLKGQLDEQGKQMKDQSASIAEFMAFMKGGGHNADKGRDDRASD